MAEPEAFQDCVYVVTGASRGIGRAITAELAARGAYVGAIARRGDVPPAVRGAGAGDRVLELSADVGVDRELEAAFERVVEWRGRLDGVVANAAVIERGEFATLESTRLEELVRTNILGALLTVRHALPHLRDGGRVVLVGSFAGRRGTPGLAAYSATKGALLAFAAALRAELAPRGITVSWVAPGPTRTALQGTDGAAVAPETSAGLVLRALRSGEPYLEATSSWRFKAWFETVAPRTYDRWIRFRLRRTR